MASRNRDQSEKKLEVRNQNTQRGPRVADNHPGLNHSTSLRSRRQHKAQGEAQRNPGVSQTKSAKSVKRPTEVCAEHSAAHFGVCRKKVIDSDQRISKLPA